MLGTISNWMILFDVSIRAAFQFLIIKFLNITNTAIEG